MSRFDRPERPQTLPVMPERLVRLDNELTTRAKDFDTIFAVRGEQRFKVSVFRSNNGRFMATVKVNGRTKRQVHDTPSGAYIKATYQLSEELLQMKLEKNFKDQSVKQSGRLLEAVQ